MRWIWIDRILELEKGRRCVAIKNVTLAEDVLHDHFPAMRRGDGTLGCAMPILPNTLVIEGMAQTAGILVGHANDFHEKVILAKISRAEFVAAATPGLTIRYTAVLERIDATGAATAGTIDLIHPVNAAVVPMGRIELMFSHIDRNMTGLEFPEHNFVFTSQFMDLLAQSGFAGS